MAPVNHFKIWKVTTKKAGRGVTLRGQFDKLNQDAVLETPEWLANPVKKTTRPLAIRDNIWSAIF